MSEIRTSTVVAACLGTTLTGLAAYAVYFDYKRRTDVEFRRGLKREAKREAKIAKEEAAAAKNKFVEDIRAMVDTMYFSEDEEVTWPKSSSLEDTQAYFEMQMRIGEALLEQPGNEMDAAAAFFKAMRVYPDPNQLYKMYDSMIPRPALQIIAQMEGYFKGKYGRAGPGSSTSSIDPVE